MALLIQTDWVPEPVLRGNSRVGWRGKAKPLRIARNVGYAEGLQWLSQNRNYESGLREQAIGLLIVADVNRRVDSDNLLIGYKPFIDGLADAQIIPDDRHIEQIAIRVRVNGIERSTLFFY